MTLKPFAGNISFNAQHSPMGAFMSFTCGHFGTRGGIGVQIGKPANQDLYIGVKEGGRYSDSPLKCLPFFQTTRSAATGAADFQVEQAGPAEQQAKPKVIAYTKEQIERRYGWATDEWKTNDFTFTVYTPFGTIPAPAVADHKSLADALRPAVIAELVVDNTHGSVIKTAFFALNFNEPGWRPLKRVGNRTGIAHRREIGLMAEVLGHPTSPELFCRWTPNEGIREKTPHLLGSCPGVLVEVPPGQTRTLRLALGCHLANIVTTGLEGRYFYNRFFSSLEQVLNDALDQGDPKLCASKLDAELLSSGLSADQQFLIAHATRSYYGSTQLLDVGGEPFWIVNEGEYCMMNTLDLSVDQVFWELKHNPWVVRNLLDNFVRHYSYVDDVKVETKSDDQKPHAPGGMSFCHDMGAHNNFSPPGHSSYELPDLTGCFSYMTAEQLCNWILVAASYVAGTQDKEWLVRNVPIVRACLESLDNRTGESGLVEFDSDRCGSGSEITTYDSLDHSLAQTRRNVYMGVKSWSSFLGLNLLFTVLGDSSSADLAFDRMILAISTFTKLCNADGFVPAVAEDDNLGHDSRILPLIEGYLYPLQWARSRSPSKLIAEALQTGDTQDGAYRYFRSLLATTKNHTLTLLHDSHRRNLFPDGGIKLSSTSNNSWMSKIALFQHVAREVFHLDDDPAIKELFAKADAAHVKWQTDGSGYWACSDQFVSGVAKGSRYYPRIITTALWLEGRAARSAKTLAVSSTASRDRVASGRGSAR